VSVSLVRFNDGAMLDARPLADACHAQGTLLALDISQRCGAIPIDAAALGAEFVQRMGPATVQAHNARLIGRLFARLPSAGIELVSPRAASARGPFGCFRRSTLEGTKALHARLADERVIVSLREGNIRVAPYLFNSEGDIDRVVDVVTDAVR
jgi:selenocysteine lyase/cysteine desulfurase